RIASKLPLGLTQAPMRPPRFLVARSCWSITVAAALTGAVLNAAAASLQQDLPSVPDSGVERVGIVSWPANSRLDLPHPFPNITAAHLLNGRERMPLKWSYDAERTKLQIELPQTPPARMPATIVL